MLFTHIKVNRCFGASLDRKLWVASTKRVFERTPNNLSSTLTPYKFRG